MNRYPQLADLACRDIADPTDNTRIFPISPSPQTFSGEPIDFYNALCGLTIFRGDALGPDYVGDAFVCESLRNLVHRRKLVPDGPTFISKRADPDREFLASSDPWFHPVFLTTGPDGALYVADFYRRWVEHPEWLAGNPDAKTIDWREGSSHGRIWRIRRSRSPPPPAAAWIKRRPLSWSKRWPATTAGGATPPSGCSSSGSDEPPSATCAESI